MNQYQGKTKNFVVDANATSLGEGRTEQVCYKNGDCSCCGVLGYEDNVGYGMDESDKHKED